MLKAFLIFVYHIPSGRVRILKNSTLSNCLNTGPSNPITNPDLYALAMAGRICQNCRKSLRPGLALTIRRNWVSGLTQERAVCSYVRR